MAGSEPRGLVTMVCITCGAEQFFDQSVPSSIKCSKCGSSVFRQFATPTHPDEATIAQLAAPDIPSAGQFVTVLRLDLLAKLALAVLLGGAVGLERELSGKPAGLRTNILICVGSAMLMDLSIRIGISESGVRIGDPARLA